MQKRILVKVVGVGADGSLFYRDIVETADLIICGKRLMRFVEHLNCEKLTIGKDLKKVLLSIKNNVSEQYKNIVVLASGDPMFFGIGKTVLSIFNKDEAEFYPYLNSVQILCNKIKMPYEDVMNFSIHGRELNIPFFLNFLKYYEKVAVLTDRNNNISVIYKILKQSGIEKLKIFVGQMLESEDEKIIETDIDGLSAIKPSNLDTLIIYNPNIATQPHLGIHDKDFFHEKGLITKKDVRILSIAYLNLEKDSILWDIGAGSGSVSIEASFIADKGEIYSIEKNSARLRDIEKNIKKFNCFNVNPVYGDVADVMENLPTPSRVFIGGNSGGIIKILTSLKNILQKNAIIVINIVSVEKISDIILFCKKNRLKFESTCVHIDNLKPIADGYYYKSNNPVHIIRIFF